MKGTTNAQRNAVVGSSSAVDKLTLTMADGTTQQHTVSDMIPKDTEPTKGSAKFVTSGAIKTALDAKVSTETGKGLSTNDYTTVEKSKVSNLPDNANNTFATKTELTNAVSSVYKYKGTKATYAELPTSGNTTGDVWNVTAANGSIPAGTNYAWNGSAWDALGGEIDLTGYVPTSRTINGKALTGNITLAAADVSAVPTSRKVNGKALSADITLSAADVGALATGGTAAKATADASGNNIVNTYATKTELTNGLAGKQNALTFDSAPTSGSSNPVTSGGVYSAINAIPQVTVDSALSSSSTNPVQNKAINTALSNKMDKATSIGSSTKPIYINSSGVPTACSYSLGEAASKSVTTSVTSGSSALVTSGAVYTAINNIRSKKYAINGVKGTVTSITKYTNLASLRYYRLSYTVTWTVDKSLIGSRTGTLTFTFNLSATFNYSGTTDGPYSLGRTITANLTNSQLLAGRYSGSIDESGEYSNAYSLIEITSYSSSAGIVLN